MSVILKTRGNNVQENIFVLYDFKQVRDTIMVVTFVPNDNKWEKIFIYHIDNSWQFETLQPYMNNQRFEWLCLKLNYLFQNNNVPEQFDVIDIEKAMQTETDLMTVLKDN